LKLSTLPTPKISAQANYSRVIPKISVVCVTNRKGAYKFLLDQLNKQTFKDFELIVADDSGLYPVVQHHNPKWFQPRQKEVGDVWNINKAYNDCLDKVEGELIVFLQDFIWIPANGLQRFWDDYQIYPEALITGVGHKAVNGIIGISEVDDRMFGEPGLHEGTFSHYELNWASCPTKLAPRFDEDMDKNYGGENQVFAIKANADIYIDRSNICVGYSQEEVGGRPADWEEKHFNKTNVINDKLKENGFTI
jgi:glycosyltransferase involved in cell wall biosynthesis